MLYEIYGAGFANKGAQLMLLTVMARLRELDSDATFAYDPGHQPGSFSERCQAGLINIFRLTPRMRRWKTMTMMSEVVGKCIPRKWRSQYGIVMNSEIDALIDISGYAYGEKWSTYPIRTFIAKARSYTARRKPVILLPQMLGPFTKPEYCGLFAEMARRSTVIYAREKASLEWARKAAPNADNIRRAPDITLAAGSELPDRAVDQRSEVLVVPNSKMLTHAGPDWAERYVSIIVALGRHAAQQGFDVRVLLHELGSGDRKLAEDVAGQMLGNSEAVEVIEEPLLLKKRISRARFIISSRFHSIAGALSTGIPAIALGWAHKYPELLSNFGVPEFEVKAEEPPVAMFAQIDRLADAAQWEKCHSGLRERGAELNRASEAMWKEIGKILGLDH